MRGIVIKLHSGFKEFICYNYGSEGVFQYCENAANCYKNLKSSALTVLASKLKYYDIHQLINRLCQELV